VLFGNLPSTGPEVAVNVNGSAKTLRALWFDAGKWYNLSGAALTLGGGLVNEDPVITVNAGAAMSEINIDNNINFNFAGVSGNIGVFRFLEITNHSEGGLRLGGTVSFINNEPFQLPVPILRVGGHGATHFANTISGVGFIQTKNNQTTHLVLSGNNSNWQGLLTISPESLGFIKRNNALPGADISGNAGSAVSRAVVNSGGTLGFRSHGHGPALNYSSAHKIQVQGQGAVRQWGRPPVGAVYNDGGQNTFAGDIQMRGDMWFGSRGDRNGGLTLTGQITGNYSFTKVGPGLITLTNTTNSWTGNTYLNGGVLRANGAGTQPWSVIPQNSKIIFDGGILELKTQTTGYFYQLASAGSPSVQWTGSGGFSAFGSGYARVRVGPSTYVLQWGQSNVMPIGKELLLSSRYATAEIRLINSVVAAGATIRVERGVSTNAYATILGRVTGGSGGAFTKKGLGFLNLSASNNNYTAQTIIEQGALGGTISPNSNITLRGGVVMLNGNFTRNVGTAPGQIQWSAGQWFDFSAVQWINGGGFAAWTGNQTVKLNNSINPIEWGSDNFVQTYRPLKFGHYTASGTVIWDKHLGLGVEQRLTIQVERGRDLNRADVVFNQEISGVDSHLSIEGDGRMDIRVDNPNFKVAPNILASVPSPPYETIERTVSSLGIRGAELRLNLNGRLPNLSRASLPSNLFSENGAAISIAQGGSLTLDNIGYYVENRLNRRSIGLSTGGAFRLWGASTSGVQQERLDRVHFGEGATTIDIRNMGSGHTQLVIGHIKKVTEDNYIDDPYLHSNGEIKGLLPGSYGNNTLNLTSNVDYVTGTDSGRVSLLIQDWGEEIWGYGSQVFGENKYLFPQRKWFYARYGVNDGTGGELDTIIPWATVNGADWVTEESYGGATYLTAYQHYHLSADTTTWNASGNVSVEAGNIAILTSDRSINSLRLHDKGTLVLSHRTLSLESGGLLSSGGQSAIIGVGTIRSMLGIGKKFYRPFYAHIYSPLSIMDHVRIYSDAIFVKTGSSVLNLNSDVTHYFGGTLYINQGTLSLKKGVIHLGAEIFIGDGAGTDVLELPSNSWDSIIGTAELPSIYLNGPRYGLGAPYGGDEAILRMGGNTKLHLSHLKVEGRGTIDWHGGEVGKANILWIDLITITGGGRLYMRNWYQYEDILLLRKGPKLNLSQIIFEGYEDFPVLAIDYDANYWQITPFHAPEPSTYGAILGALGLGVWGWRRRRKWGHVSPSK